MYNNIIDWNETEKQFGYRNHRGISTKKVVCRCPKCSILFTVTMCKLKKRKHLLCNTCIKPLVSASISKIIQTPEYQAKLASASEAAKEKHAQILASPEYQAKYQAAFQRAINDPANKKKHIDATTSPEYKVRRAAMLASPEYKASLARARSDPENKKKHTEILASPEYKAKHAAAMAKVMSDEDYRLKHAAAMANPETLAKIAAISAARWQDLTYREKMVAIANAITPEIRQKISAASAKLWDDEDYRSKHSEAVSGALARPEVKANMIATGKRLWEDDNYREKHAKAMAEAMARPDVRAKLAAASKKLWEDDVYREKMAIIMAQVLQTRGPSSIQFQLYQYLDDLGVQYHREGEQTAVGFYVFDCKIPLNNGKSLLIECQGDYWHSDLVPTNTKRDRTKFTYINRYFPEYEIMYVWEHEFSTKDRVIDRLKAKLGIELETVEFDFNDIEVKECPSSDYRSFLDAYHYIGRGRGGKCYGAYLGEELIACCAFSPPVRQNLNNKFGEFVELSRFCIHPSYHKKNFASWLIARCVKLVDAPKIVAYADTTVGHDGGIYKASNFTFSHRTPADYWYTDADGYVMRKKKLYDNARRMMMTEAEYSAKYGYTKRFGGEKLCYVLDC